MVKEWVIMSIKVIMLHIWIMLIKAFIVYIWIMLIMINKDSCLDYVD